ncbi:GRM1B protein, partial [Podargus strigoides]|nr:GRM1B protein [Podargus strigoides]
SDIVFHPWKKEKNGNQTRVISYTIAPTNPLAPKTATVTEIQTMYKDSQKSKCYVTDAEILTHDVPHHKRFYTINHYMLTHVARNKSRLRVSTELRYRKPLWGPVKSFFEKNFWSDVKDHFRCLGKSGNDWSCGNDPQTGAPSLVHACLPASGQHDSVIPAGDETWEWLMKGALLELSHQILLLNASVSSAPTQPQHVPEESPSGFHLQSKSKLLLVISFILLLLVPLNVLQCYQLRRLENTTRTCTTWQGMGLQER